DRNRLDLDWPPGKRRLGLRQRERRNRRQRLDAVNRRRRFDPQRRRFALAGVLGDGRRYHPHALDRWHEGRRRGPLEEHEAERARRRARRDRRLLREVDARRPDRDVEYGADKLCRRVDEPALRFDHWQPTYRRERTYSCGVHAPAISRCAAPCSSDSNAVALVHWGFGVVTTSASLNLRAVLKTAIVRSGMDAPARAVSGLTSSAQALLVAAAAQALPPGVILFVVPGDGYL